MKKTFILLFTILLSGCATTANYEKKLNTWVGTSVDDLILGWGEPEKIYQKKEGGRIFEYSRTQRVQTSEYSYTVPQTTFSSGIYKPYGSTVYNDYYGVQTTYIEKTVPATSVDLTCTTRFAINDSDIVTDYKFSGNDCKASK